MRVPHAEFLALDLEAHALLTGIPLRDVSAIDLPGGGDTRTIADVLRRMEAVRRRPVTSVKLLVALRRLLGQTFQWDGEAPYPASARRLSDDQRRRSRSPIGAKSGPLRLVYEFPYEMVGETTNRTVHALSCMALRRQASGYRLYWAIYVENVSVFTRSTWRLSNRFGASSCIPRFSGHCATAGSRRLVSEFSVGFPKSVA